MIDLTASAVTMLLSRSAISAAVGAHVYAVELPAGFSTATNAPAAIVLSEQTDSDYDVSAQIAALSLEARCFGPNPTAARATFRALYDGLRSADGETLTNVTVGGFKWCSVWIDGGGQPQQIEATKWEFVLCTVRALVLAT